MLSLENWSSYLQHVENTLGGARPEPFERAVELALEEVGRWILPIDGKLRGLPSQVTDALARADTEPGEVDVEAVATRVGEQVGVRRGQAVEFTLTILRATDDGLDDEGRKHFRRNLPDDVVASFERSPAARTTAAGPNAHQGHTLADGKPGSRRSVAEADVAEDDSPAATTEPHADTKLSTSKGYGQERRKRTLAEGKPGSSRPVSDEKS